MVKNASVQATDIYKKQKCPEILGFLAQMQV